MRSNLPSLICSFYFCLSSILFQNCEICISHIWPDISTRSLLCTYLLLFNFQWSIRALLRSLHIILHRFRFVKPFFKIFSIFLFIYGLLAVCSRFRHNLAARLAAKAQGRQKNRRTTLPRCRGCKKNALFPTKGRGRNKHHINAETCNKVLWVYWSTVPWVPRRAGWRGRNLLVYFTSYALAFWTTSPKVER